MTERFERCLRELLGIPRDDVALDDLMMGGMGVEPPSSGDFAQLDAAVGLLVLHRHRGQRFDDIACGHVEHLRELAGADRLVGYEEQRLEFAFEQ